MGMLRIDQRLAGQGNAPAPVPHTLAEVFAEQAADAAAAGFVLARLPADKGPILWVQDRVSAKEAGRPYLPGMGAKTALITLTLSRAADVLWALEEGLRCASLGGVVGELWGDPPALDFTATKRLAIRAEASGVDCWLIRRAASPNLSAARDRWRVGVQPAAIHPDDALAPGLPRWGVELFRSRRAKPGRWVVSYDGAADRLDFAAASGDRTLDARDGAPRERAAG